MGKGAEFVWTKKKVRGAPAPKTSNVRPTHHKKKPKNKDLKHGDGMESNLWVGGGRLRNQVQLDKKIKSTRSFTSPRPSVRRGNRKVEKNCWDGNTLEPGGGPK